MSDDGYNRHAPARSIALPDGCARVRKFIFLSAAFFASIVLARADLIMEEQSSDTNATTHTTLKLHANKMRLDQQADHGSGFSVIIDLGTRDSITLMPKDKMFLIRAGVEIQQQMETERKVSHGTNAMDNPPARAVDTGKTAKVGGYDTEIYTWSGVNGLTETLWVATNFPDYEAIRTELAKLDRFDASGPHQGAQPVLGILPGMVVKTEKMTGSHDVTVTLLSAKIAPVDATIFELPADYSAWKQPAVQAKNEVTMPGNHNPPPP